MTEVSIKGSKVNTVGELPKKGTVAPSFTLLRKDLSEVSSNKYKGKKVLLNIFPSLDTSVCAESIRKFNRLLSEHPGIIVLHVSKDLPFAANRFCSVESLPGAEALSAFNSTFGRDYGVEMKDGPLRGLLSRAVVVLDENGKVVYEELVNELSHEPNYEKAVESLGLKADILNK